MNEKIGSLMYLSPEIIEGKEFDSKCDIWATGCIIHIMFTGIAPYMTDKQGILKKLIVKMPVNWDRDSLKNVSK